MTIPPYLLDLSKRNVIRSLPTGLTIETKLALAKFVPEILNNGIVQTPSESLQAAILDQRRELIAQGIILEENLNNFQPRILAPNSVVQGRREFTINARQRAIIGKSPLTRELEKRLKQIDFLGASLKELDRLSKRTERLIDRINTAINIPNQIVQAGLTSLIGLLDALDDGYEQIRRVTENAKKLYDKAKQKAREAWLKLKDLKANSKEKIDRLKDRFSKFREIPRRIKFPKRPRLPNLNLTRANFFVILRKYISAIKKRDTEVYKQYYEQFVRDSAYDIESKDDSGKSPFQRQIARYRNNLILARARAQATQAVRTQAANNLKRDLRDETNNLKISIERERAAIIENYQAPLTKIERAGGAVNNILNRTEIVTGVNTKTTRQINKIRKKVERIV